MCRVLSYLGEPIVAEDLLYKPDNSFVKQSYHPQFMENLLNLAGFGMVAWDNTSHHVSEPHIYKTIHLPFYDENLANLAAKTTPYCLLAHIRGVAYSDTQVVSEQNVHPFIFRGFNIALAHNGSLYDFEKMKYDLLEYIQPEYRTQIHGTTDSEWIYAIFMSRLPHLTGHYKAEEVSQALLETLEILKEVRQRRQLTFNSPVNLFVTNGEFIAASRFVFDYGWIPKNAVERAHLTYHSLWYTFGECYGYYDNEFKMKGGGKRNSIIIASEPLTEDSTTWIEVPEYTLLVAERIHETIQITSRDIQID